MNDAGKESIEKTRASRLRLEKLIDVQIGELKTGVGKVLLKSAAIGSCLAIVAYDAVMGVGGLVHGMLPGSAPAGHEVGEKTKYAGNAIDAIVNKMSRLGSKTDDIEVVLVGAGNILKREDDTICKDNIESALELLGEKGLKVRAKAVGGTSRKSVCLDVERGIVFYSEGNGSEMELWRAQRPPESE